MRTAERMFAERGVHAVSLREIGSEAGQRNNNAVQYHFGDRDGLVGAIYAARTEKINERRLELLEKLETTTPDVPTLLRVLLQPHAESLRDPDNHFVSLLARLMLDHGTISPAGASFALPFMGAHVEIRERVRIALAEVPRSDFDRRFDLMFRLAVDAFAFERARPPEERGDTEQRFDEIVEIFVAGLLIPSRAGA